MGKKKKKDLKQARGKYAYALISLAAFLTGVGLLLIFIFKAGHLGTQGIIDKVYYILLFPFALSAAAFLFKVMPSSASFKGKVLGGVLKLGGPVVLFFLVLVGGFYLVPDNSPFDFTVFLQDAGGKTVLKDTGTVRITLESDRRSAPIDQQGSVTYKRIPARYRNIKVPIQIEAPGWRFANHKVSALVELTGHSAPMTIERDESLAGISGFVMDAEGRFINGAKVIVRDLETVTNENGWFSLSIPPPQQQKKQTLYISKPGYRTWSGFVYPAQGQELQIRLEGE